MIISLDTETTGLDIYHGARPFLVTTCDEDGNLSWWEWDVDPLTREVVVPYEDMIEIQEVIDEADGIVMHNAKFDLSALYHLYRGRLRWDWEKIHDTTYSAHLLRSTIPRDLTTQCLYWINRDISRLDEDAKSCVKRCRDLARSRHPEWRIARKDLPEMPSATKEPWKSDLWLPRAVAAEEGRSDDDPYWTVCSRYANGDSAATVVLYRRHREELRSRGLDTIYEECRKRLPVLFDVESTGVTVSKSRLNKLAGLYGRRSTRAKLRCQSIASSEFKYDLKMPKSGVNNSLRGLIFDEMGMEPVSRSKKTGEPSLNQDAIDAYLGSSEGPTREFFESLVESRKYGTSTQYLKGYRRFWLPVEGEDDWMVLHPSLNATGTGTLRMSSSNPNEQNISNKKDDEGYNLRYVFGPAPGREWWSLDYENLELRIPAYDCREPAMLELFENPDAPPYYGSYHLLVFDILHPEMFAEYGVEVKNKFKDTWYGWTKNGNFAELYGAVEASGTADRAFHVPGAQRRVAERLTKKSELNEYWVSFAQKNGYVETMPDSDVDPDRGYPLWCPLTDYGRVSPTVPLNYRVQGTACWVMMRAMSETRDYLEGEGLADECKIVMNVHDEIVLDLPEGLGERGIVGEIRSIMESLGDSIGVRLTVGVDYHPENWKDGVSC